MHLLSFSYDIDSSLSIMYTEKMVTQNRHWWDWLSVGCLVLLLFLSSYSLEDTGWIEDLNHVTTLALLGLITGLAIGYSQFNKRNSQWLAIAYSIILILLQVIFLTGDDQPWLAKLPIFFSRVSSSLHLILTNQPLQDGVLFFISMAILYWFVGFFAGFNFSRFGKPWMPVMLAGISMIVIQLFQSPPFRNNLITAGFFFLLIILIGRVNYLSSHHRWDEQHVTEDKDVSTNFNRFALMIAILLIATGWSTPLLVRILTPGTDEQEQFGNYFNTFWDVTDNFFAPFQQKTAYGRGFFGDTLDLGFFRVVSEDVVFLVDPIFDEVDENRYYWSARKYDVYLDGVWKNGKYDEETVSANEELEAGIYLNRGSSQFVFKADTELFQIYTPGELSTVDRDIKVLSYQYSSDQKDVIALFTLQPVEVNQTYRLNAITYNPYREDLISAEGDYPQWVLNQYLQLPRRLPQRIKDLAQDITFGKETIYDKVEAITNYLRSNLQYADVIDQPSDGSDLLDWFLFEEQKGFCNYFATAEVILLRTLGIPARISVGYAQGQRIENSNQFEVRGKDHHAWPEVFFPEIGWVIFEPTPSQPIFIHRQRPIAAPEEGDFSDEDRYPALDDTLRGQPFDNFRRREFELLEEPSSPVVVNETQKIVPLWLILLGLLCAMIFITHKLIVRNRPLPVFIQSELDRYGFYSPNWLRNWSKTARYSPVQKRFSQINRMLRWLGVAGNLADTPQKRIQDLVGMIPSCEPFAMKLLDEYQREVYGPYRADVNVMDHELKNMYFEVLNKIVREKINHIARSLRKRFR